MTFFEKLHGEPVARGPVTVVTTKPANLKADHTEARRIYQEFILKAAELKRCQEYAFAVAKATDGASKTPVRPLATMGCNGGPLLCDHCRTPIILEGGDYHNVYANNAWRVAPESLKATNWVSYIKGGLVVRIVENGTLRIYHGYPGMAKHCCTIGEADLAAQEDAFVRDLNKAKKIHAFLCDELKDVNINQVLSEVMNVMFSFDPGLGVNQP